jgi:cytochrome oxidase Cu insertion factor (SCO1/SenC/PrrC family)
MTALAGAPPRRSWLFAVLGTALALAGCRGDAGGPESQATLVTNTRLEIRGGDTGTTETKTAASLKPTSAPDLAAPWPAESRKVVVPDVTVVDQDGRNVRFYSDLVKGRVAAINFVFTSCKAGCPLLSAGFSKFQETLGDRLGKEVALISISVDPMVDRPERLKGWARRFGARPGWTFVTAAEGHKADLDSLLKALQVYTPEKTDHAQSVLVVDGDSLEGRTSRKLASPNELEAMVGEALKTRGGRNYFTDTTLVDQNGHPFRFYSDLVKGKVVVINAFFTACKGSCPVMSNSLVKLQERVGDRLGKDINFLSLTVDPAGDNLEELARYAKRCGARPGWHFLTGTKEDLARVESKLGQYVENREAHASIMIVGNDASGVWMKQMDPADVDGLYRKLEEVMGSAGGQ